MTYTTRDNYILRHLSEDLRQSIKDGLKTLPTMTKSEAAQFKDMIQPWLDAIASTSLRRHLAKRGYERDEFPEISPEGTIIYKAIDSAKRYSINSARNLSLEPTHFLEIITANLNRVLDSAFERIEIPKTFYAAESVDYTTPDKVLMQKELTSEMNYLVEKYSDKVTNPFSNESLREKASKLDVTFQALALRSKKFAGKVIGVTKSTTSEFEAVKAVLDERWAKLDAGYKR